MLEEKQRKDAIMFFKISFQYITLVENVAKEIVIQGNKWVIIKDSNDKLINEDEYDEEAKWSDFRIIIPLIFNFLHGIELLLKGFLILKGIKFKIEHINERLFKNFIENYPDQEELINHLESFIDKQKLNQILAEFVNDNQVDMVEKKEIDLYQMFRFPCDPKFETINNYASLVYKTKEGVQFFSELEKVCKAIRKISRALALSLNL